MKLWLLQAKDEELPRRDNPWEPWYDKAFGHVVRAETKEDAREIAHEHAGDENTKTKHPWKDQKYSTCVELTANGDRGLVMTDFHAA
jgi:hypothetical protein